MQITPQTLKGMVRRLRTATNLPQGKAQEVLAHILGYRDWNTLRARVKTPTSPAQTLPSNAALNYIQDVRREYAKEGQHLGFRPDEPLTLQRFVVTVLHRGTYPYEPHDLSVLHHDISFGDMIGVLRAEDACEVPRDAIESILLDMGNDGSFFGGDADLALDHYRHVLVINGTEADQLFDLDKDTERARTRFLEEFGWKTHIQPEDTIYIRVEAPLEEMQ